MSARGIQAEARAKKVFRHYMIMLYTHMAGKAPDSDNIVEWDGIVEDIITAAREGP